MAPRSFHDRPKTAPVQLAGPVALQLPQVVGSAVPLVREKAVLGVADVGPRHEPIPEYLRDDGRRGDGQAQPVALDDRTLLDGQRWEDDRIEEEIIRGGREVLHSLGHRESGRLEDVHRIDDLGLHPPHTDIESFRQELRVEMLALGLAQELRIPQAGQAVSAVAGERPPRNRSPPGGATPPPQPRDPPQAARPPPALPDHVRFPPPAPPPASAARPR